MPGRNGTGPLGIGPMTDSTGSRQAGRGAGFCVGRNRGSNLANQNRSPGMDRNSAFSRFAGERTGMAGLHRGFRHRPHV